MPLASTHFEYTMAVRDRREFTRERENVTEIWDISGLTAKLTGVITERGHCKISWMRFMIIQVDLTTSDWFSQFP